MVSRAAQKPPTAVLPVVRSPSENASSSVIAASDGMVLSLKFSCVSVFPAKSVICFQEKIFEEVCLTRGKPSKLNL